jgi:hypothetical protein
MRQKTTPKNLKMCKSLLRGRLVIKVQFHADDWQSYVGNKSSRRIELQLGIPLKTSPRTVMERILWELHKNEEDMSAISEKSHYFYRLYTEYSELLLLVQTKGQFVKGRAIFRCDFTSYSTGVRSTTVHGVAFFIWCLWSLNFFSPPFPQVG